MIEIIQKLHYMSSTNDVICLDLCFMFHNLQTVLQKIFCDLKVNEESGLQISYNSTAVF